MTSVQRPTMRSRKLGKRLRALREERALTLQKAARLLNRTPSSLSKLETGKRGIRRPALEYLLDRYEIADVQEREYIFDLAARADEKGWWHRYEGTLLATTIDYISLESEADSISSFQLHLIPGLLQTADYARAIMEIGRSQGKPVDVDAMATVRLRRQQVLVKPSPPQFTAVISEAVLRQQIGGAQVMKAQLRHLIKMTERENVKVHVLPYSAGAHGGVNGSFSTLNSGGLRIVLVENLTAGWYLEEESDIRRHDWAFGQLLSVSLCLADSLALIKRLSSES